MTYGGVGSSSKRDSRLKGTNKKNYNNVLQITSYQRMKNKA